MDFVGKYRKIVNRLIKKSFPHLKNKKIRVIEYNFSKTRGGFIPVINLIGPHRRCRNLPDREIEAILAHEISHLDTWLEMGFFKKLIFCFKHTFSKKSQSRFETAADRRVIEKGYAHGLYSLVKNNEAIKTKIELEKRFKAGYLNSKQIKKYAQKIGKW